MRKFSDPLVGVVPPDRILTGITESSSVELGRQGGYLLFPRPITWTPPRSPLISDIHSTFDLRRFAVPRRPIEVSVGSMRPDGKLPFVLPFVISEIAIKMPGTAYRVPRELMPMASIIQRCIDIEHAINPHADEYFAYVTLRMLPMTPGARGLSNGVHSDGIQGVRIQPKRPQAHLYVWTDRDFPRFYIHPFDMTGLDVDQDWLDLAFTRQADRRRSVSFRPGRLVLLDTYCAHEAIVPRRRGWRLFFRLTMTVLQHDREGNTRSALFEYPPGWQFQPRPAPRGLRGGPQ